MEKFTTSGSGNYYVPKWENAQHKVECSIESNIGTVFFRFRKVLAVENSGYRALRDTAEKEELIMR